MKTFIRLEATKQLRTESFEAYIKQKNLKNESYKDVAVRRLLRMSICNIIGIEYLDIWAKPALRREFGTVKFPFLLEGEIDLESKFMKCK